MEIFTEGNPVSARGNTSDLSIGGFYIETMFTMTAGAFIEVSLFLNDEVIIASAIVATCDPLVGNGISFTKMLPDDQQTLSEYIAAHESLTTDGVPETAELDHKTDELLEP